jgi:hypothetical protein
MSPCTAKLSAFRSKQVGKYVYNPENPHPQHKTNTNKSRTFRVKPKSLFAQASAKKLEAGGSNNGGGALFGSSTKPAQQQQQQEQSNPFGN